MARQLPAGYKRLLPANYKFPKELPAAAASAFLALEAEPYAGWWELDPILEAVDYPNTRGESDWVGPRADMLTPAQRAAVELITELNLRTSGRDADAWMPHGRADRRSWLGLDPPQPLDKLYTFTLGGKAHTEPGWRALKLLQAAEDDTEDNTLASQWLAQVPLAERIAMWGQVNLRWPESWGMCARDFFDDGDDDELDALTSEGKAWAPAYADALLAALDAKETSPRRISPLPLLVLVRAKIPIEPRWDVLLPLMRYTLEILQAMPQERRAPALLHAMKNAAHPAYPIGRAIQLIGHVPSVEIAELAIQSISRASSTPRQDLARLAKAAQGHPEVVAVIRAAQGKEPQPIKLKTLALHSCSSKTAVFNALEQSQLLAAGCAYFGKTLTLEQLLSTDDNSEESIRHVLSYRAVGDAKCNHVYDMWEFMGDSGSVFEVGTTNEVAAIVQASIECDNRALCEALEKVMRQKAPKAPVVKKRAAKKAAAKKKVAKKPVVKKLAAKKAVAKKPAAKRAKPKKSASRR